MIISLDQLSEIMPRCPNPGELVDALGRAMWHGEIRTVNRASCFVGQLALESGELRYWQELADGSAYEGRKDLGNIQPGDGPRYKGRGPIQLTGRANYRAAGQDLGIVLEDQPELAAEPSVGFEIARWYWQSRGCNLLADAMDIEAITRAINGGMTHHERRRDYTLRAREVLARTGVLR